MNRIYYISAALLLSALSHESKAQTQPQDTTMNRVMVVEQEYTPEIVDASRIDLLPKVELPVIVKSQVEYAISATPAKEVPAGVMPPLIVNEQQPNPKTGFLRLGAGNYGNVDVLANYLFLLSPKDKLDLYFKLNGMKGNLDLPDNTEDWKSHYYRTRAAVNYLHHFNQVDFNLAGQFGLSNFNFIPNEWADKQRFTSGSLHIGAKSTTDEMILQFEAETNLQMYERKMNLFNDGGMTESRIKTRGNVWGAVKEEQYIGVVLEMNNLLYQGKGLKDYTTIDLNPYYHIFNDIWNVRVGAHVDLAIGHGKGLRAAPDVKVEYTFADSYVTYVKATGGRMLNDFNRLEVENPYANLNQQVENTYEQINAAIGIKGSPMNGLWFNLFGGYQELRDDLYNWFAPTATEEQPSSRYQPIIFKNTNTENAYGGATISYNYKEIINLSATGIYRHWKADEEWALLYKPNVEFNFNADFRPLDKLLVNLSYQYMGRPKVGSDNIQIGAINNLNVGASYQLLKFLSVFGRVNNLLNKSYQWYFDYPTEKLNFVAGVGFKF